MQYLVKTVISAVIIVTVSELSKRNQLLGGLIASLPVVSILAMIWLYLDTKSPEKVAALSMSIFWMVLPSLCLFLVLPLLLKKQIPFYWALTFSCLLTSSAYYLAMVIYGKLGINL